jgi:hypothetical protein
LITSSINGLTIFSLSDNTLLSQKPTPHFFSQLLLTHQRLLALFENNIYISLNYGDTWTIMNTFEVNIKTICQTSRFLYALLVDGSVYMIYTIKQYIPSSTTLLSTLNDNLVGLSYYGVSDKIIITPGTWVVFYSFIIYGSDAMINSYVVQKICTGNVRLYYSIDEHTNVVDSIYKEQYDLTEHIVSGSYIIKVFHDTYLFIRTEIYGIDGSNPIFGHFTDISYKDITVRCEEIVIRN